MSLDAQINISPPLFSLPVNTTISIDSLPYDLKFPSLMDPDNDTIKDPVVDFGQD